MIRRPFPLPTVPNGVDLQPQFQQPQFMDIHHAQMDNSPSPVSQGIQGIGAALLSRKGGDGEKEEGTLGDEGKAGMLTRRRRVFPIPMGGE